MVGAREHQHLVHEHRVVRRQIQIRAWLTRPKRTGADAYGPDRSIELRGTDEIVIIVTHGSGGWYDIALTTPGDPTFSYQLAGRLESNAKLTSDPQLGR